jgi:hypothetical protein
MRDFTVGVSAAGMRNFPASKMRHDFLFCIGDARCPCSWIVADFLSPKIARLHATDPSITEYEIETPDSDAQFQSLLSIADGGSLHVNSDNCTFFLSVSRELGNCELYLSILGHIQEGLSTSTVLPRVSGSDFPDFSSEASMAYLASHFCELKAPVLDQISLSALFHILSHDLLLVSSEDALYDYISSRLSANAEYFELLRFVRFEYLSAESSSRFIALSHTYFDRLDYWVWNAVSRRLSLPVSLPLSNPRTPDGGIHCAMKHSEPLNGIISYLTRKHGGNIHDKGIVTISAKSVFEDPDSVVRHLADLTNGSIFNSDDEPGQWICWDFHEMRVRPVYYTLRSGEGFPPRSWLLESSLDGLNWTEIDRQVDNDDLNDDFLTHSYTVSNSDKCRFIRFTQTDQNHYHDDYLRLCAFEVFGTLLE